MATPSKALPVRDVDALKEPPFVIITGPVGVGKSVEVAISFQKGYVVASNPKVLRAYESFRRDHPEMQLRKLDSYVISKMKLDDNPKSPTFGEMIEVNVEKQVRSLVIRWARQTAEGTNPYEALIFDEWSTISQWIYEQMPTDRAEDGSLRFATKKKADSIDQFAVIAEFKRLHHWLCQVSRVTGKAIILISHSQEPKYQDDPQKPHFGKMLYPGGPTFPIGTLIRPVCAEADVVLELRLEDGVGDEPERFYLTQPSERFERKCRDFRIKPKEPVDKPGKLRELLERAGFPL